MYQWPRLLEPGNRLKVLTHDGLLTPYDVMERGQHLLEPGNRLKVLTHDGLFTPYDVMERGQHWYQAIT